MMRNSRYLFGSVVLLTMLVVCSGFGISGSLTAGMWSKKVSDGIDEEGVIARIENVWTRFAAVETLFATPARITRATETIRGDIIAGYVSDGRRSNGGTVSGGHGMIRPHGPSMRVFLPESVSQPFRIESGGHGITVRFSGEWPHTAVVHEGVCVYHAPDSTVLFFYKPESQRLKEFIYIEGPPGPDMLAWEVLADDGLELVTEADGLISLMTVDERGFFMEPAYVIDATGTRHDDAVRWRLDRRGASLWIRLDMAVEGMRFPLLVDPTWTLISGMRENRMFHSATVLRNGKVLFAGGLGLGDVLRNSAELWDLNSGTWSMTGVMNHGRYAHTATLLQDGRVLVAGGSVDYWGPTVLKSAEIYDPATEQWTLVAPMITQHSYHTATLLPDGKVMVIGGRNSNNPISYNQECERYDPVLNSWTTRATMPTLRGHHTATWIESSVAGILVAGGTSSGNTAIFYDPTTNSWSDAGVFDVAHWYHTATATVLSPGNTDVVLLCGGEIAGNQQTADCQLYDIGNGTWSTADSLDQPRDSHNAVLLPNASVMVTGGSQATSELFNPETLYWETPLDLGLVREFSTAVTLPSGDVLITGGKTGTYGSMLRSSELYTWTAGTVTTERPLLIDLFDAAPSILLEDGRVLQAGGWHLENGVEYVSLDSSQLYDPVTMSWQAGDPMIHARSHHSLILLPDGSALAAGGYHLQTASILSNCERFDPIGGTWSSTGSLIIGRHTYQILLHPSGKVMVVGGIYGPGNAKTKTVEAYDPATGTWSIIGNTVLDRGTGTVSILDDGKLLLVGGSTDARQNAEIFDPVTGTSAVTSSLNFLRQNHGAVTMPDGRVLVAGGSSNYSREVDIYDPLGGLWTEAASLNHDVFSPCPALLLGDGRILFSGGLTNPLELYDHRIDTWDVTAAIPGGYSIKNAHTLLNGHVLLISTSTQFDRSYHFAPNRENTAIHKPVITSCPSVISFGTPFSVVGTVGANGLVGRFEGGSGTFQQSTNNYPLVLMHPPGNGPFAWLAPTTMTTSGGQTTLEFTHLPTNVVPGWNVLQVIVNGIFSDAEMVFLSCGLVITHEPLDQEKSVGESAVFSVETEGGRYFQWEKDGIPIAGATQAIWTTAPLTRLDHGTAYRCRIWNSCTEVMSETAFVIIRDETAPEVALIQPDGGEVWDYSPSESERRRHLLFWDSNDDFGITRVRLSYRTHGAASWTRIADSGSEDETELRDYAATDTPIAVPDNNPSGAVSTITVTEDVTVEDVEVKVWITHTYTFDLELWLIGPDNTTVPLSRNRGGSGDNYTATVFDDEAAIPIGSGSAPFTGRFRPEQPLSIFDSTSTLGQWRLQVIDEYATDIGTIDAWTLTFTVTVPASGDILPGDQSYSWQLPTRDEALQQGQILPTSEAKVRIQVWDRGNNAADDESANNFYLVQPTTSSIKTLIVWHSGRICTEYDTDPGCDCESWTTDPDCHNTRDTAEKLDELASHSVVSGFVLDLKNIDQSDYTAWDAAPTNQAMANAVAGSVRQYILDRITTSYTETNHLIIVGNDTQVPFYRMADGTSIHPESNYPVEPGIGLSVSTTVGSAIAQNYLLTDNYYAEFEPQQSRLPENSFLYLHDLAIGRLVETPTQIGELINTFLAYNGQVTIVPGASTLITGLEFLHDSAMDIVQSFATKYTTHCLLDDPDMGGTTAPCVDKPYTPAQLESALFNSPLKQIMNINSHANHFNFSTSIGSPPALSTTVMQANPATLPGTVLYTSGCHSGLTVPPVGGNTLDLPELMAEKKTLAYIGNTGYAWGLKYGDGLTERLMKNITAQLLGENSITMGKALARAKRDYYLKTKRYDVFDEKVLHILTLFGIPNTMVVMDQTRAGSPPPELAGPTGPDRSCAENICLTKSLRSGRDSREVLPGGLTELELNFSFGSETYTEVITTDGRYYKLNGQSSGEVGEALQPKFVYNSHLEGTNARGVLFTGGHYTEIESFNPVIAVPRSTNTDNGEGSLPRVKTYVPSFSVSYDTTAGSAQKGSGGQGYTTMIVHTGYFDSDSATEFLFDTLSMVAYYSNDGDTEAPSIVDPGEDGFHSLHGLTVGFTVEVTDASPVFRVLVTWNGQSGNGWDSLDLEWSDTKMAWEGFLPITMGITYFVQAIDSAGNVGVLSDSDLDRDGLGQAYGSTWTGPKMFSVTLHDSDADGLPDAWEDYFSDCLDRETDDADADPDFDYLRNIDEFHLGTNPCVGDTDGGGDNDGSELNHNRNARNSTDDVQLTIALEKNGDEVVVRWHDDIPLSANASIDGHYFVYRSDKPVFLPENLLPGPPIPHCSPRPQCTNDGLNEDDHLIVDTCADPLCFYTVRNSDLIANPLRVITVYPAGGPSGMAIPVDILGTGFLSGPTVTICGQPATEVVVHNENRISCMTPVLGKGLCDITVAIPNLLVNTLADGYEYQ